MIKTYIIIESRSRKNLIMLIASFNHITNKVELMKHIAVCLEHRFYQVDGRIYTKLAFPYFYWKDYLSFFDKVTVIARVKHMHEVEEGMTLVSGEGVDVYPLPYYVGLKEFIYTLPSLIRSLYKASDMYDHFLLRSGNSTNILFFMLLKSNKPYIREYPGNIKQGVIGYAGNSLRIRLLATLLDQLAKAQARYSAANSFVSNYCRELYSSKKPSFVFSSFKSSEIKTQKLSYNIDDTINIISVGRLEGEKGHIDILKALNILPKSNYEVHFVGDGSQINLLKSYASLNNINAIFYGAITDRQRLFNLLEKADIYIIPSLTEGMPRSLLEAMTIGLPCLGSNVGGIPEVLNKSELFDPNNPESLKEKILELSNDTNKRVQLGKRNIKFIEDNYTEAALTRKKHDFWSKLYE